MISQMPCLAAAVCSAATVYLAAAVYLAVATIVTIVAETASSARVQTWSAMCLTELPVSSVTLSEVATHVARVKVAPRSACLDILEMLETMETMETMEPPEIQIRPHTRIHTTPTRMARFTLSFVSGRAPLAITTSMRKGR